jgi:hypothetical protein
MKKFLFLCLISFLGGAFGFVNRSSAGGFLELTGTVFGPGGSEPIPNAIVSLVSVQSRAKKVAYTDEEGVFVSTIVVPQAGDIYLEIYWDRELYFRRRLAELSFQTTEVGAVDVNKILQFGGVLHLKPIKLGDAPQP